MQWVSDHSLRGEAGRLDWRAAPLRAGDLTMAPAIDGVGDRRRDVGAGAGVRGDELRVRA